MTKIQSSVRVRPQFVHEKHLPLAVTTAAKSVCVQMSTGRYERNFDHVFTGGDPSLNQEIYKTCGAFVLNALKQKFNSSIVTYGQTGTGKTHTITGNANSPGILFLLCEQIWEVHTQRYPKGRIEFECFDVYNDQIYGLSQNNSKGSIRLSVLPQGVTLVGLNSDRVMSAQELVKRVLDAQMQRITRATDMNAQSSRGHCFFRIKCFDGEGDSHVKIAICDLAGRENEKTTNVKGSGFVELTHINKSLHFLSACVLALSKKERPNWRNCKLTSILQETISGNSQTHFITCVSPLAHSADETFKSLQFCGAVSRLVTSARKSAPAVPNLSSEVERLRSQLEKYESENLSLRSSMASSSWMASSSCSQNSANPVALYNQVLHKRLLEIADLASRVNISAFKDP